MDTATGRTFVKKVKYNGKETLIEYSVERDNATDHLTLSSTEPPTDDFKDALVRLRPFVAGIWGWAHDRHHEIEVRGCSFDEDTTSGKLAVVVTAIGFADRVKGCLVMNSSRFTEGEAEENPEKGMLTVKEGQLIRALQQQAKAYINGERGEPDQPALPFDAKMAAAGDDTFKDDPEGTFTGMADGAADNVVPMKKPRKEKDPSKKPGRVRVLKRASDDETPDAEGGDAA